MRGPGWSGDLVASGSTGKHRVQMHPTSQEDRDAKGSLCLTVPWCLPLDWSRRWQSKQVSIISGYSSHREPGLEDMHTAKRLFNNTLALTIASAGHLVGNVILFFYLSRLLQAEGLGIYATVIAVFQTAALGCGIGLSTLLPREIPKDFSQTNRYLIHGGLASVAGVVVLIVALDLLVPHLGYLPQTQTGLYIASLALLPESIQVILYAIFISYQKAKFIAANSLFLILGRISVSLLALRLGFGVVGLIVIFATFSYLALLMNFFLLNQYVLKPHWEFDKVFLHKMLRELKVFAALALLNALCSQSEVIILSLLGGEIQVGYYSAALKLVTIWAMVPTSYMTATFPVLSATYQESRQKAISLQNRSLKYLIALALPLAIGITVTAGTIIPMFYGPGFQESIGVLRLLAWYLPLVFCNMLLWRVLTVRGDQKIVFQVQLMTEVLQALLAVWLIPTLGYYGAVLGLLGGNLAYMVCLMYYVRRDQTPLPLIRMGWRFVLASAAMGIVAWLSIPWLHLLVVIPVAAVVYFVVLWILKAFSPEDVTLFKELSGISGILRKVRSSGIRS